MNGAAPSRYVIDTNVMVEAAKRYYAFDIVPTFWEQLTQCAENGRIVSIDRVKDEVDRGKDDLTHWCGNHFYTAFLTTQDCEVLRTYGEIMEWAQAQTQYTDAAKAELAEAKNADAWIVAYAIAYNCIVVTHERSDPTIKRRIPIPNICQAFHMQCVDTFQMMRQLGIKL